MLPTDLLSARQPLRVSVQTGRGPLIVPLWFDWDSERLWCATQRDAAVVKALHETPRCAFDLSTNDMPYRGIRGRGNVRILPELGGTVLDRLIDRYRIDRASRLATWLLSRRSSEVAIEITPTWQTGWDYSERMAQR
jgi:nitroimidazol reductase NimA-like FMN-containing flavoprotein (pyridoxamine 5'-phosphate oxidase superfamily)